MKRIPFTVAALATFLMVSPLHAATTATDAGGANTSIWWVLVLIGLGTFLFCHHRAGKV